MASNLEEELSQNIRKGFLITEGSLHLQMRTLRPREGKRLALGSQQIGGSVGPQAPDLPRPGSKVCLCLIAHSTKSAWDKMTEACWGKMECDGGEERPHDVA